MSTNYHLLHQVILLPIVRQNGRYSKVYVTVLNKCHLHKHTKLRGSCEDIVQNDFHVRLAPRSCDKLNVASTSPQ